MSNPPFLNAQKTILNPIKIDNGSLGLFSEVQYNENLIKYRNQWKKL